jgi:hypothetical protein
MLPARHQAWAETTGALWSSRMIRVNPFSSVIRRTPLGMEPMEVDFDGVAERAFLAGMAEREELKLRRTG